MSARREQKMLNAATFVITSVAEKEKSCREENNEATRLNVSRLFSGAGKENNKSSTPLPFRS